MFHLKKSPDLSLEFDIRTPPYRKAAAYENSVTLCAKPNDIPLK